MNGTVNENLEFLVVDGLNLWTDVNVSTRDFCAYIHVIAIIHNHKINHSFPVKIEFTFARKDEIYDYSSWTMSTFTDRTATVPDTEGYSVVFAINRNDISVSVKIASTSVNVNDSYSCKTRITCDLFSFDRQYTS